MENLRNLFFGDRYSIKRASALLAITALLSNILGLVRNLVFYRVVPPGQLDAYLASFKVPDFLFNILILGAVSSAFVPILNEVLHKKDGGEQAAWELTDQVFSWLTLIFVLLSIGVALAMKPLVTHVIAPGFRGDRLTETIFLSRLLLLQSIFLTWSYVCGGLLNSFKKFSSYALAPLIYNIFLIIGGVFSARFGITAIVTSAIVGAALHFLIQFREVRQLHYWPHINFKFDTHLKELLVLMLPRSLTQGMAQFTFIVYTSLASGLLAGSIAVFYGVNDLQTTPTMIVANSVAVAFFPSISARIAREDWESVNTLLSKVVRLCLFGLLPSIVLTIILRAQIIRLYVGIGHFDWHLTNLAISTFLWFLLGVVPASLVAIFARVFYAFKDTRTPLLLSTVAGLSGIAVAVIGIDYFHGNVVTLAAAVTVSSWIQCILYLTALCQRQHIHLNFRTLFYRVLTYTPGSLLLGFTTWATLYAVHGIYVLTGFLSTRLILGLALQATVAASVGTLVFIAYSKRMYQEEYQWVRQTLFSRG